VGGGLLRCADRVGIDAPVTHTIGVGLEVRHLRLTTWEEAVDGRAASPVVGLVCDMSSIAKDDDGSD
jgi:hypothetical protein